MKIYGLTGKTGAGKSTVAEKLSALGFYVIDGDKIARSITEKGKPAISLLANEFGCDIIESDGSLNRKLLASRAFALCIQLRFIGAFKRYLVGRAFDPSS